MRSNRYPGPPAQPQRGWPQTHASPLATEEYGRRLLRDTAALMGPDHADADRRYSGSRMACASCHLGVGTEPGTLSLLQSAAVYPRFSGRDGGVRDLVDRIKWLHDPQHEPARAAA